MSHVWGVDSSASANNRFYNCLESKYGKPKFWGRYLTTIPKKSEGLTEEEVSFIHSKGIKILPIYNNFTSSIGKVNGEDDAKGAIQSAKKLGLPQARYIFANVEYNYPIDKDWIIGWSCTILKEGFLPGIYNDPTRGEFNEAFCKAQENSCVKNTILWSRQPQPGVTSFNKAPEFSPKKPSCEAKVLGWQYGVNASVCPPALNTMWLKVDTSLFREEILEKLW